MEHLLDIGRITSYNLNVTSPLKFLRYWEADLNIKYDLEINID